MAEAVRSVPSLRSRILPSLSPDSNFALRFAIATTAAIWIGKTPGLVDSHSTWILITVLMLVEPTGGASLLKSLLRAAGTLAAALTAIVLFGLFAQQPPLLMASFFLTQAIGAYGYAGPRFQYAWFVWAFTTAIVLGSAMSGGGAVETVAFERASMVLLGILLVYVVDALVSTSRAEQSLRDGLAAGARSLASRLEQAVVDGQGGEELPQAGAFTSQLASLDAARTEIGASSARLDKLERTAGLLEALTTGMRALQGGAAPENEPEFRAAAGALASRAVAALERIATALEAPETPLRGEPQLEHALAGLGQVRDSQPAVWSAARETRFAALRDVVGVVRLLEETLSSKADGRAPRTRGAKRPLRVDPFRMKIALRAGIAVVIAFLVPAALGWPMNTTVAPVAFMMAATPTRGAVTQQLGGLIRVLAIAWIVADLVIVFVTPYVARAPLAMLPAFVIALVFATVTAKYPQLGALPTIGGLVVFLSAYGGMAGATGVDGPYDTVCYIGLALAIGVVSGRLLWPATASQLFRQRIAAQLELCLDAVRTTADGRDDEKSLSRLDLVQRFSAQFAQLGSLQAQASLEPIEHGLDPDLRARLQQLTRELHDAVVADRGSALPARPESGDAELQPLVEVLDRSAEVLRASLRSTIDEIRNARSDSSREVSEATRQVERQLEEQEAAGRDTGSARAEKKLRILGAIAARCRVVKCHRALEDWLVAWREAQGGVAPAVRGHD